MTETETTGAAVEQPETVTSISPNTGEIKEHAPGELRPLDPSDPLNAAIAATAGEAVPVVELPPYGGVVPDGNFASAHTPEQRAVAMEAYIQAGVAKAVAAVGNAEIVTAAAFRLALAALFRHLHLDHPENYLPKG